MASLNKVMLIGRLGQFPEKRVSANGKTVVKVSLATNDNYTDKSGFKQDKTEWHNLVFWEKLADIVNQYCDKGSLIYVEGSIKTKEWIDKQQLKHKSTEINVYSMQFLEFNKSKPKEPNNAAQSETANDAYLEDDLPF